MIVEGEWNWPSEWQEMFPVTTNLEVPVIDANGGDSIIWKRSNGSESAFAVKIAYEDLNVTEQNIVWWELIWFTQCVPKHSFVLWLAVQKDKMTKGVTIL